MPEENYIIVSHSIGPQTNYQIVERTDMGNHVVAIVYTLHAAKLVVEAFEAALKSPPAF